MEVSRPILQTRLETDSQRLNSYIGLVRGTASPSAVMIFDVFWALDTEFVVMIGKGTKCEVIHDLEMNR